MKGEYGESEHGNFRVFDTIPIKHPFVITAAHVAYAADKCGGKLTEEAIQRSGVPCGYREGNSYNAPRCQLTLKQHESALLVYCKVSFKDDAGMVTPELHQYLLKIKAECEKNGYVGFAFTDKPPRETPKPEEKHAGHLQQS